ncbi:MAG: hypothetical protein ABW148_08435 [Sedimenticola sp.]
MKIFGRQFDFWKRERSIRAEMKGEISDIRDLDSISLSIGKLLASRCWDVGVINDLRKVEFKIFSQWGDDGIIQYLISHIGVQNDTFIEFGCGNYRESNTRFLLVNDNWRGLVMDSSPQNITTIQSEWYYWRHDLTAKQAFITSENINTLIERESISGDIGILHIDVDGNDYWIWKAIEVVTPEIVIVEYNSLFGAERAITVPYGPDFDRYAAHFSGLFAGSSLTALCDLAQKKGYAFIGSNSAGNNAYFVRNDRVGDLPVVSVAQGYVQCRFREHRNADGDLTFQSGEVALEDIRGLAVYNTRENRLEDF